MTREVIKEKLMDGFKVKHRYFTDGEYIYLENNDLKDENGYVLNWSEFWNQRQGESFDNGWSKYQPSKHI